MMSWRRLTATAAAVLLAVPASAAKYDATIHSTDSVPDWQMSIDFVLQVSVPGADIMAQHYSVVPLTPMLGFNQTQQTEGPVDINGDLVLATVESYVNIAGSGKIAYLSCDNVSSSFIDANTMFNSLLDQLPAAILLYSEDGNGCSLSGGSDLTYQNILTMVDRGDASQTLNITQTGNNVVRAEIIGNSTQGNTDASSAGSDNSAIAMNVLYSITGLVTLLFLVIIATGAVRAHRNPERYGPRSGYGGRPRQSRAKGLARAVLETLPIVKFGDPTPAKPDPSTELESIPDSHVDAAVGHNSADAQAHHLTTISENSEAAPKAPAAPEATAAVASASAVTSAEAAPREAVSGIGEAKSAPASRDTSAAEDGDHLGCSICTEDFLVGEDVRVLPCDHKFHPHCVDPWLVNVSGTCPLCRLDLRPNDEGESATTPDGQSHMPPPLETDDAVAISGSPESTLAHADAFGSTGRRLSSRLFDLHRLRHAPVEERIEALRRYRVENQAAGQGSPEAPSAATGGEDEHSHERLTKRLRDKFRIRTRAQSPSSSSRG